MLILLSSDVWGYEAPEDKQDVFASRACPAFLTFKNLAYLAGVTVELPCHCKPQEVQSVVWFFRKHQGNSEETRALTDNHGKKLLDTSEVLHSSDLQSRFSIRLFSLLLFRAGLKDSGLYICGSTQRNFFFGYDLDIQEAYALSYHSESLVKKIQERKGLGPPHSLYQVFTTFQPWSMCDRCGVPGEQVRIGLCFVHSRFLHVRYRWANQTVVSCGSGAVPRAFGHLKQSRVGPKLEVKSCQVPCPTEAPPTPKLLALMVFLGYSSAALLVQVPVYYVNHKADNVLTLGCPGARPSMAVAWDQGSKPIYRYEVSAGGNLSTTPPRLLIDAGHHLVFQPAKTKDSGSYYCWLQGRRAAEIRLLVYPRFGHDQSLLSHPELPAAVKIVLTYYAAMTVLFCLLVFCRAGVRYLRDKAGTHVD
ncbi:Ig-like V-type domain-containing protein FAM187A [Leuresthes tenuis]|uniref:Ig-like V-type domain-containing protein FAM187A n=1 Tax=Leuresthes tenuis TaxID=355514 RepID=UPI003B500263